MHNLRFFVSSKFFICCICISWELIYILKPLFAKASDWNIIKSLVKQMCLFHQVLLHPYTTQNWFLMSHSFTRTYILISAINSTKISHFSIHSSNFFSFFLFPFFNAVCRINYCWFSSITDKKKFTWDNPCGSLSDSFLKLDHKYESVIDDPDMVSVLRGGLRLSSQTLGQYLLKLIAWISILNIILSNIFQ